MPRPSAVVVSVVTTLLPTVATGCFVWLDHELPLDEQPAFVATPADFAGYEQWPSVVVGTSTGPAPHDQTERRVYVNAPLSDDDEAFPVGTIVVKTGSGGALTGTAGRDVHAMVKRGTAFNVDGARGWEFFELGTDLSGAPLFVWRGAAPPAGETYGCPAGQVCGSTVGCNDCHAGATDNDSVLSPALTLGNLDQLFLQVSR